MNVRLRRFFSYYKPYRGIFLADITCALLSAVIALIIPLCVRHITQDLITSASDGMVRDILLTGLFMLALIPVQTLCTLYYDCRGHAMGAMMERDMRAELFDHLQQMPLSFFDRQSTGALMSRITTDLTTLVELYHHAPEDLIIFLTKFIGAFVILFRINARLTLAVFVLVPVMAVYTLVVNKRLGRAFRENLERIGQVNANLEQSLSGIRTVKSCAAEAAQSERFARDNNRFLKSRIAIYYNESYLYTGILALTTLVTVTAVALGGVSIARGQLSLSDLITFLLYIGYLIEPIPQLARITDQYQQGISGFNRFMDIMQMETENANAPNALRPQRVRGDIDFQDVSFRYRENAREVLAHVSLSIKSGECVALVGRSGVGKTTLCSLIPRLYDVCGGAVLLDGMDVRNIDLKTLRRNIAVVAQDTWLFDGTVADNIRFARPDASMEEVERAARSAGAHEFISALENGYDTLIGERGVLLSGGERQRLSIARAFLKDAPVLILDEATSALDAQSERVVQKSIETLLRGRTTLIIAHRLSTVQSAGRIIVLGEGGVAEEGAHAQLLSRGGEYARLYGGMTV